MRFSSHLCLCVCDFFRLLFVPTIHVHVAATTTCQHLSDPVLLATTRPLVTGIPTTTTSFACRAQKKPGGFVCWFLFLRNMRVTRAQRWCRRIGRVRLRPQGTYDAGTELTSDLAVRLHPANSADRRTEATHRVPRADYTHARSHTLHTDPVRVFSIRSRAVCALLHSKRIANDAAIS